SDRRIAMNQNSLLRLVCAAIAIIAGTVDAQQQQPKKPPPPPPLVGMKDDKLTYRTEANGDRVPDYSYAGYRAGDAPIPDVPIRIVVSPAAGDQTARIQAALDAVAKIPADQRGAVLLLPGKFEVNGGLRINASGVVLRGSGM